MGFTTFFSCNFFCIGAPSLELCHSAVVLQFLYCYVTKMHMAATQECIWLERLLFYDGVLCFARKDILGFG